MLSWNKSQWDAFGRHILTAAGSAFAALVMTGAITSENATAYLGHLTIFVTAILGLASMLGPIYASIQAANSASPERQAEATVQNLEQGVPLNGKKDQLIAAVAEQPEVKKVQMVSVEKAVEIPSKKVTA